MKSTAVLIYNQFCNFEFSVALEMLAIAEKPITVFAKSLTPVRSEEGLAILPDKTIDELVIEEFDSLLLTGAADIRETINDESILTFIQKFDNPMMKIGAISIAPILLLKAGMLKGKIFMAGINKDDLFEEGFTENDLAGMVGWDDNLKSPIKEWALAFGEMVGVHIPPETFGLGI